MILPEMRGQQHISQDYLACPTLTPIMIDQSRFIQGKYFRLRELVYSIYTPTQQPEPIPYTLNTNGDAPHTSYCLLPRTFKEQLKPPPKNLLPYQDELEQFPINGFFRIDIATPPQQVVEAMGLFDWGKWPDYYHKKIAYLSEFTAHPQLTHPDKLATLIRLFHSYQNLAEVEGISTTFIVLAPKVREFVEKTGVVQLTPTDAQPSNNSINRELYRVFPGYWQENPGLYQVEFTPNRNIRYGIEAFASPQKPYTQPESINPNTETGVALLANLLPQIERGSISVNVEPFKTAVKEAGELITHFAELPTSPTLLLEQTYRQLSEIGIKKLDRDLHEQAFLPLFEDLVRYGKEARQLTLMLENFTYLFEPSQGILTKYVPPEIHRFVTRSRLLGLVPYETIDALRMTRIVSIGASIASSAFDLLVSHGAENILARDGGYLDPSNQPRMPRGDYSENGQPKTDAVNRQLYARNPYGSFNIAPGRVVPDEGSKTSPFDLTFEEVCAYADLVIEAIDAPHIKTLFREYVKKHAPQLPIIMPTDVGSQPYVSYEIGNSPLLFNQKTTNKHIKRLSTPPASPADQLSMVYQMVQSHFPLDHQVQFTAARLELIPYWSQIPSSARESAALATKIILFHLQSKDGLPSRNYRLNDLPQSLMPQMSNKVTEYIKAINKQLFALNS